MIGKFTKTVHTSHDFNFVTGIMKTSFLFLIAAFALSLSAQTVEIPDPGLQQAIRNALDKPEGYITVEDMESLTVLEVRRKGASPITSFEGIEAAKNLVSLKLVGTTFFGDSIPSIGTDDLSPLGSLSNLTTLDLWGNQLATLTLPQGLSSLTRLDLGANLLTNLTLPEDLTDLTSLNLSGNKLKEFSFLEGLTSLTSLWLAGNELTSLTLPEGLTSLRFLHLDNNQLTALVLPEGLTSLTRLVLTSNQLTSLTLPEGLTSLTRLYLSDNELTTLRLPEGMVSLTQLLLGRNPPTALYVPVGVDIGNLERRDFFPRIIKFYIPLTVELVLEKVEVNWTQGILQSTDAIAGAWSDIPDARSPYQVELTARQRFFRVKSDKEERPLGGTVWLNNRIVGTVDARVTFSDGYGVGAGWTAQLYGGPAGTPVSNLQALTPTTTFRTSSANAMGYVNAVEVTVPDVSVGQIATLVMRVYSSLTYESSINRGQSNPISVSLGGGNLPAAALAGLSKFTVDGGTVQLNNRIVGTVDARVTFEDGSGVGSGWTAQLYGGPAGTPVSFLKALTPTTTFRTSSPAAMGYVNPVNVTVLRFSAGELSLDSLCEA